jgi:TetR/AcrR family transcriptional regulator
MGLVERKHREHGRKREDILDAARRVILRDGVNRATMSSIAQEADFSKAALYLYFKDKEEIVVQLVGELMESLVAVMHEAMNGPGTACDKLLAMGERYVKRCRSGDETMRFLNLLPALKELLEGDRQGAPSLREALARMIGLVGDLIKEGIRDGSMRPDLDATTAAVVYVHLFTAFIQRLDLLSGSDSLTMGLSSDVLIEEMFRTLGRSLAG